ncbi:hypothetical protein DESUT3_09690 [Desulfuromonas versatilis]|uniref:Zinc ribbon domain-containing protein n=1 Tax=Desulfuromonas versatilis TaxID=2802975 RepID=A0ABM8HTE3_9BACT|nr:hypothetical protein [Desulfuromonas versatilis]BCR03900.1 hypothetical protein DESUT3_09690 [Desulfuromonas versatilis]
MDLSISYECPDCKTIFREKLTELFPGRPRLCRHCGGMTRLTPDSLRGLAADLREFIGS